MRILVIEDDPTLGNALREFLGQQGYAVDWLQEGDSVVETLVGQHYDLLLLDLNLPGKGGLEVLRELRCAGQTLPVLILTARDTVEDRVAGLDSGADDYVIKPFELPELAARVRALGRRRSGQAQPIVEAGPLQFDTVGREVRVGGERLNLSVRELSVLEMLMMRAGRVVTKQQIVNSLSAWDADFSENAVEVYIYRLRRRLEGTGASIQTVRGFGYLLETDEALVSRP
ncbi:MAG TPA: response regulator transcription factor [Burkholderiaceae bacterium]|nr:response regulator transcription factor [Burkholderiaceae bacterium]